MLCSIELMLPGVQCCAAACLLHLRLMLIARMRLPHMRTVLPLGCTTRLTHS